MKPKQDPKIKGTKQSAVALEGDKAILKPAATIGIARSVQPGVGKLTPNPLAGSGEKPMSRSPQIIKIPNNPTLDLPSPSLAKETKVSATGSRSAQERATTVEAKIDIGFGNLLYIRGQGDGLNWDEGKPLQCVAANRWVWSTISAKEKVVFKLLINDRVWSQGEDLIIKAGEKSEVVPVF